MLQRALRLHQDGDLATAESLYRDILRADSRCADAAHLLGLIALQRKEFATAIGFVQSAIDINPAQPLYRFNLGNIYRQSGDPHAAAANYRAALALQPDDADTLNNLGSVLQDTGNNADALACYERACALKPDDAQILGNLGALLFELDRLDDAARCFEQAIGVDSEFAEAHNNLGAIHQSRGDLAGAQRCYEHALDAAPDFAHAHKNLASVLHLRENNTAAIEHYRAALRLQPNFPEAEYELAALTGATRAAPPQDYVAGMFDQYAHEYDTHMTGVLAYGVPQHLYALLAPLLPAHALDMLDLGCGTGLSGTAFKEFARSLVGIDLSPKMIDKARARDIYDELRIGHIADVLSTCAECFDLALAADVFVYLGDLDATFGGVAHVLRPGGWFAFSVERSDDAEYRLRDAGRYAHSAAYIRALARRHHFLEHACRDTVLRKDYGGNITGQLWVLRKP